MLYPGTTDVSADKICNMDYSAEKILNTIFENSNEGLLVIGKDGIIQQVNASLAAAFKTYPDRLIGRRLADICKNNGLRRLIKVVQN